MLESMQKLHDTVYRLERLLAGSKQSERDLPRLGNEYSQILYLRNKLEVEGCGLVHAIEPVRRQSSGIGADSSAWTAYGSE